MVQLMPLPLNVSCFSKIQIGFIFLVPVYPGSPGQRAVKTGVCVCLHSNSVVVSRQFFVFADLLGSLFSCLCNLVCCVCKGSNLSYTHHIYISNQN